MGDTLQGHGLFTASDRLAELASDSARLARARNRLSDSPPSYRSQPSGTTTRSQSSNPPTEEQRRYDERVAQLMTEHRASWPRTQWRDEAFEEGHRMLQARVEEGTFVVKERWIEQGIWNDKWGPSMPTGLWKHEEPLDLKSESDSEDDAESRARSLFSGEARSKASHSEEKLRRLAERQILREREREASRPFHQFVYQASAERERIRSKTRPAQQSALHPADINSRAYENVKATWVKRGIWNHRWGILPGMNWKHEEDLDAMLLEELGPRPEADLGQEESEIGAETSPRRIFGPFSPVEPPDLPDEPQGLSPIIGQTSLQESHGDQQPPAPDQPGHPTGSREDVAPSVAAESPRQGGKAQPRRGGRARRTAGTDRGPVSPAAKVNKSQPKKTKPNPSRRGKKASASAAVLPEPQPSQATLDRPEPPAAYSPETPRRSRRIQTRSATKKA
ncbi:hypothetical protein PG988_003301 [Apiospora saccharicola]